MTSTLDSTDNGPVLTLSPPQLSHLLFPAWTKTPPSGTKWSQTALSPIDIYTRRLLFCCRDELRRRHFVKGPAGLERNARTVELRFFWIKSTRFYIQGFMIDVKFSQKILSPCYFAHP